MTLLTESSIIDFVKTKYSGSEQIQELDTILDGYLDQRLDELAVSANCSGYESALTTKRIPKWIRPLHFEENVRQAIESLELVELAKRDALDIGLIKIQLNHMKAMLSKEGLSESEFNEKYENLKRELRIEDYEESVNFRLMKNLIDLIEFSKGAKLGAKLLFGIDSELLEYRLNVFGVARIRESLRNLLLELRRIERSEQEIIVPISLKRARIMDSNQLLVSEWHGDPGDDRRHISELNKENIEFDLGKYKEIRKWHKRHRLEKIGVRVIDAYSTKVYGTTVDAEKLHPKIWQLELSDQSFGYKLGEGVFDSLEVKPIVFNDVQTSIDAKTIYWSNYDAVKNFNADRSWKLTVDSKSHNEFKRKNITDIVLYFHLNVIP